MEGKAIKEEVIESKDHSLSPSENNASTSTTSRRNKGMKSPGSPDGDTPPPPPCTGTPPAALLPSPPGGSSSPPTRPSLGKLKRFLSTLVQFGNELSPELGDRVRGLVLSLAAGTTTIEEFHGSLQEMTNFPLRPFVLPFLRSHLPLMQREIASHARLAKQNAAQYLRHHEQLVLDPSCSPSEPSEIFHSDINEGKRKHAESIYENGVSKEDNGEPAAKRQNIPLLFNPLAPLSSLHPGLSQYQGLLGAGLPLLGGLGGLSSLASLPQVAPPPHLLPAADLSAPVKDDRAADEEWKNINTMLNCILSMVEKTKRALSILQTRDRAVTSESDLKRAANEIVRIAEDRVGEIKRRAEEAVSEVKRQAMVELERLVVRNGAKTREEEEEAPSSHHNLCWNCGRKAQETCSGCNVARYCGAVCQHRDWENHHQLCCTLDRRNNVLGNRIEERRNVLEERRTFTEEQSLRRHSSDENRRHDVPKDDKKDKEKEDKERRLLPGALLTAAIDRRKEDPATFASLRGGRCLRTTPPMVSGVADK